MVWEVMSGIKKPGIAATSIFYVIAGVAQMVILAMSNFAIMPIGVLAVSCLIAAYGLVQMRKWAVWLVMGLFFPEITFAATTLHASILQQEGFFPSLQVSLFHLILVIFGIMTFVALVYILAKRQDFQ